MDELLSWRSLKGTQITPARLLDMLEVASPVDPVKIALALGVKVCSVSGVYWDGMLAMDQGIPVIRVHAARSPERRRFTVAHELGHLLRHGGSTYRCTYKEQVPEEREANRFAIELLMPDGVVEAFARSAIDIGQLARAFGVSTAAMSHRLKELDLLSV